MSVFICIYVAFSTNQSEDNMCFDPYLVHSIMGAVEKYLSMTLNYYILLSSHSFVKFFWSYCCKCTLFQEVAQNRTVVLCCTWGRWGRKWTVQLLQLCLSALSALSFGDQQFLTSLAWCCVLIQNTAVQLLMWQCRIIRRPAWVQITHTSISLIL